jgi:RNA polymerase sigma factor (sigma-70 family)
MDCKWLDKVAKHHKEYVNIVRSWGEFDYAEDIVQETYLKLLRYTSEEKIVQNGKVSKTYVWYALRSVYIEYLRSKNKIEKVQHLNTLEYEDTNESEKAYGFVLDRIQQEMDSWQWFDEKMFKLYLSTDDSMRDIAKKTNISLRTVFTTIKRCKELLKENVSEDWEDFVNGDFERI